jgi:hypothetical protein
MRLSLVLPWLAPLLAACVPAGDAAAPVPPPVSGAAAEACLREVTAASGNGIVTVLDAQAARAGTRVTVGVGPDRAPWSCLGYAEGTAEADSIVPLAGAGLL